MDICMSVCPIVFDAIFTVVHKQYTSSTQAVTKYTLNQTPTNRLCMTSFSFCASNPSVGSSSNKMLGAFNNARAVPTLLFSPPLKFQHFVLNDTTKQKRYWYEYVDPHSSTHTVNNCEQQ